MTDIEPSTAPTVTDSPSDWVAEHTRRYLATGGTDGHEWHGVPTLLLTTIGRTSGIGRRTALIYGEDPTVPGRVVLVASKGGAPEHPNWYLNLAANPAVEVQVKEHVFAGTATTAQGADRARLWELMAAIWPDYRDYATRTDREIPVVVVHRRARGG
jgi:deazaflavin-dependent oxidoreductase (nitroreductase family)